MPDAADALTARVIEDLGFEVIDITGAGIANMHLGARTVGAGNAAQVEGEAAGRFELVSDPASVRI